MPQSTRKSILGDQEHCLFNCGGILHTVLPKCLLNCLTDQCSHSFLPFTVGNPSKMNLHVGDSYVYTFDKGMQGWEVVANPGIGMLATDKQREWTQRSSTLSSTILLCAWFHDLYTGLCLHFCCSNWVLLNLSLTEVSICYVASWVHYTQLSYLPFYSLPFHLTHLYPRRGTFPARFFPSDSNLSLLPVS